MPTWLYFLLWGAFFFMMMRFGCGAHIMGHGHGHRHGENKSNDASSGDPNFPSGTEVKNEQRH